MSLKEEHKLIQQTAKEFAAKSIMPFVKKNDEEKIFPKEIIKKAGELGFMGMLVPAEYGGSDVDEISYCLVLEEIAYACASSSVIISVNNMVCWAISEYGNLHQKQKYLLDLASGKKLASFALTEPDAGSDSAHISLKAKLDGEDYILNGTKIFVTSGSNSDLNMVMAVTNNNTSEGTTSQISAFLVEKNTPGLNIGKIEDKMGLRASDTVELNFDNCKVPKVNLLGVRGEGFKIAMNSLNNGRIGIAAQCVGIAKASLDEATKYAKARKQFGKTLSEFEGIQWMLADIATEIEASRCLTLHAATLQKSGPEFIKEASMAKLFASETANRAAYKALQVHGGYGYSKDYTVERLYRDARATTIYEGTSEIQRLIIARHLLKQKEGPWDER